MNNEIEKLLITIKNTLSTENEQPFSVYTSFQEQVLLNVPILKPLLVVVLSGDKELGVDGEVVCHSGDFIFLSDSPAINMRNIPKGKEYFALLIEFEPQDFHGLETYTVNKKDYIIGQTTATLEMCLQQFIECSVWAPKALWSLRKREIISLLYENGHTDILSVLSSSQVKARLHEIFINKGFHDITTEYVCAQLAMSESTLRRKLKLEGTSLQAVKDQSRLGLALHYLQTTAYSVGMVADKCGYQSQSRFTERFKKRFGLTPSELRKTKMND